MDKFITFVTVVAWVVGIASTLYTAIMVFAKLTYTERDALFDAALRGIKRTFPVARPALLATICWAWVIAFW